ncbi:galactokinase [Pontibacter sp. G13]|uniref:galactokinase n=1 Tax=Pontibacter sp. G13 TaxID=3074898 RepID=UPI00288A57FE|nr:galactokinase [Pontibacter sp. G13]WNJ17349.1 galactokinase [Pontibacter sp. G13]
MQSLATPAWKSKEEAFLAQFGTHPTHITRSPGRINVIGEHTDYNLGLSLPAAIDKCFHFLVKQTGDQTTLYAIDMKESWEVGQPLSEESGHWAHYFQAMHQLAEEAGLKLEPIQCVFGGDIPVGGGLSSSAALCCGYLMTLNELFGWNKSRMDIALMAQQAEHRVGIKCGLLDQMAVLFGKAGRAIELNFKDLSHQSFNLNLDGYALMLIDTKVKHSLVDSPYNKRRQACEDTAAFVRKTHPSVDSVSDMTVEMLEAAKEEITPEMYRWSRFILKENARVIEAASCFEQGDLVGAGARMYATHTGLSKEYEVSCEELDILVDLAKADGRVLGARMMGGGFGGCTINLVQEDVKEEVAQFILNGYKQKTGVDGAVYMIAIEDGVTVSPIESLPS